MKKLIVAIAAFAMMTGSAIAADWNFYGSARVSTFWSDTDTINGASGDTIVAEDLQGNARIGANVKASDELTGRFEYGASGGVANIRLLYGEWNFGAGKLLVGQDYVPMYLPGSNQVYDTDNGLGGYGEMYGGRKGQLKLKFGGFQIAAVKPSVTYYNGVTTASGADIVLPMIQAQYGFGGDNWAILATAGYNTFDVSTTAGGDVTSWGLGLDASLTLGALKLIGQVSGGTNVGNLYGMNVGGGVAGNGYAMVTGTNVIDNDALACRFALAYTVNEMFGLEVGYGFAQTELDTPGSVENEVQAYYVQAPITMAPGVFVIPEVGVVDQKEAGQSDMTYFGAKWQINF